MSEIYSNVHERFEGIKQGYGQGEIAAYSSVHEGVGTFTFIYLVST